MDVIIGGLILCVFGFIAYKGFGNMKKGTSGCSGCHGCNVSNCESRKEENL